MREIKLRAYYKGDIELKQPLLFEMVHDMEVAETLFRCVEDPEIQYAPICVFGDPEWIIMQFTGLYDKNGIEIYEGDIVRQAFPNYSYDEVDGDMAEPRWIDKISHIEYRGHGFWVADESFGWEGEDLWDWELMEVIGNIYQNPELIHQP